MPIMIIFDRGYTIVQTDKKYCRGKFVELVENGSKGRPKCTAMQKWTQKTGADSAHFTEMHIICHV